MARRGFTLIEILVSLVILGVVAGMTMTVFQYQNRNFKTESDKAEVAMSAKGIIDEMSRMIRMTGGGLKDSTVGLKVYGNGEERVTFVINSNNWVDTSNASRFDPGTGRLSIAVDSASKFNSSGYVQLTLFVPLSGATGPGPVTPQSNPSVLRVVDRVGGCGTDSIILDASRFLSSPYNWTWIDAVTVPAQQLVYNLDSVSFRKSRDTLLTKWNRLPESVFAVGVDTLRLQYFHPSAGWRDSLSGTAPANRIDKVRIRLVVRTREVDRKLLAQQPASRGYRFSVLETEVSLRNDNLINL